MRGDGRVGGGDVVPWGDGEGGWGGIGGDVEAVRGGEGVIT